jgi:adenylate cyclase
MGIHMGLVVVGDIGTPNRINYTIVGDTVNATQRLESLNSLNAARILFKARKRA